MEAQDQVVALRIVLTWSMMEQLSDACALIKTTFFRLAVQTVELSQSTVKQIIKIFNKNSTYT